MGNKLKLLEQRVVDMRLEVGEAQVLKVLGFYIVDSFTGVSEDDIFYIILVDLWSMGLKEIR